MPPKRQADPEEASQEASKRAKVAQEEDEEEVPLRRSPRKAVAAKTTASSARNGVGPKSLAKHISLKSWLSNGSAHDKKAVKKAVEAAVQATEDEGGNEETERKEAESLKTEASAEDLGKSPDAKPKPKEIPELSRADDPEEDQKPEKTAKEPEKKQPAAVNKNWLSGKAKPGKASNSDMAKLLAQRTAGLKHCIGAHVSMSKGVHNAVMNAKSIGANAFALFLKGQRKWDNPALQDSGVKLWQDACKEHSYSAGKYVLPHGSYLINLASQTSDVHEKSINSFLDDLDRCERLGIGLYNFHPGNTNGAPRAVACKKIADAINLAHEKTKKVMPVLETMASNKATSNAIGGKFEDLAMIIKDVKNKDRIGVCIDTCHTFAAGYDIVSEEGFKKTMEDFDKIVGRKYLKAWHLNDSKATRGSGRDLHANIGTGFIGLRGFWNIMNMDVWGKGVGVVDLPMVLETPIDEEGGGMVPKKGEKKEEDKGIWAREIKLLESLIGMDPEGEEFQKLSKELSDRGAGQREKMKK